MQEERVDIVGYGAVGKGLYSLFPGAVRCDEPLGLGFRAHVNRCTMAFIAVPTPPRSDGSCDTSVVEDVVRWLEAEVIVICSTVAVGTTDRLRDATRKRIVFQPEFAAPETPNHPFQDRRSVGWLILGGEPPDTGRVAALFRSVLGPGLVVRETNSRTAELTKYMENTFLALKVSFFNEFYDIARHLGVDYGELRELLLLDPRIGPSHTLVMPEDRGFGGRCLPKDLDAIISTALAAGYAPSLLLAARQANKGLRAEGVSAAGGSIDRPG